MKKIGFRPLNERENVMEDLLIILVFLNGALLGSYLTWEYMNRKWKFRKAILEDDGTTTWLYQKR